MKKRKKIVNRLIACVLGVAFLLSGIHGYCVPAEAGTLSGISSEEEVFPDTEITQDPSHTDSEEENQIPEEEDQVPEEENQVPEEENQIPSEEEQLPATDNAVKLKKSVSQVIKETSKYILSMDKNPTLGSEWFVLGLARNGKSLKSKYFETYYNHIANYLEENDGKLTNSAKYTEYSKQILVMTAIGRDARNIAGYNLLENLADFNKITEQGFNGAVWALIALNSNPDYTIPKVSGVSEQTTEKKLIRYLLKGEISGGGWSLQGEEPDVDITAMTLQALAPYYQKKGYEKVTAAVDRGVNLLSKMQLKTGGFSTMGVESLESNAQVITALCALGIDPKKDSRFIKNGKWTVENLITYHVKDSGFVHVKSGNTAEKTEVNGMTTGQGFYALVAYQRFREGKTSLYDMSDLTVQKGEKGDGTGTGMADPKEDQSVGKSNSKTTGKRAGQAFKKSSEKTDVPEKETGGWSFSGKTYVPDSASLTDAKTDAGEDSEKVIAGESEDSEAPEGWSSGSIGSYIVVFVLGAAFGAGVVFITGRRKQNEKKN